MSERTYLVDQRPMIFEGESVWNAMPARDVEIRPPQAFVVHLDPAKRRLPSDEPQQSEQPVCRVDNPNLELRRDSHGRLRWQLAEAVVDEIRACLLAGEQPRTIVKRMGVGVKQVYAIRSELGIKTPPVLDRELPPEVTGLPMTEAVQTLLAAGWRNREVANALLVSESYVSVIKHRTLLASTVESEAQLLPEIAPSATPVAPAQPVVFLPTAEPVRPCYVIDWAARMNAWRFEDRYKPPRPKSHKSTKVLVHAQIRDVASRSPDAATTLNCRPPAHVGRPQSIAALAEAEIFGGEK